MRNKIPFLRQKVTIQQLIPMLIFIEIYLDVVCGKCISSDGMSLFMRIKEKSGCKMLKDFFLITHIQQSI